MVRIFIAVGVLALGLGIMTHCNFFHGNPADGQEKKGKTPFAIDRAPGPEEGGGKKEGGKEFFDGQRAMGYLKATCDIGPRMSATSGMTKQQELIRKHFEKFGFKVADQTFKAKQASRQHAVEMTNMIVSIHPERKRRIIVCSHYDTRPIADQEPDVHKWKENFVSANDGGSGVAFLMEMAHHAKELRTQVGIDFVFFDGEEYIFDRTYDQYFFGSKHFAEAWKKNKKQPEYIGAVLLDMIAGKNAKFPMEGNSYERARRLSLEIWRIADKFGCHAFLNTVGEQVLDDHLSLLGAGIPAIDIIDFSYPHWHRLSDTPENCAPEGMIQVAKVLISWIESVK